MTLKEPLDLEYWFVNVFSGNWDIFSFIGVLLITSMAAYFKMNAVVYAMFLAMFALLLAYSGTDALLIILILVLAPILFWWIRRYVE